MSVVDEFRTPDERWQTRENLRLVRQFYREYLGDPKAFDAFSNNDAIVLLPPDDANNQRLTYANMQMARRLAAQGQHVLMSAVGMHRPGQTIQLTKIDLATRPKRVVYNPDTDALTITFDAPTSPAGFTRIHPMVDATFDPDTRRLTQMIVHDFTRSLAPRAPQLLDAILSGPAEISGISRDELERLRDLSIGDDDFLASLLRNSA